jgi:hypothetical protein
MAKIGNQQNKGGLRIASFFLIKPVVVCNHIPDSRMVRLTLATTGEMTWLIQLIRVRFVPKTDFKSFLRTLLRAQLLLLQPPLLRDLLLISM